MLVDRGPAVTASQATGELAMSALDMMIQSWRELGGRDVRSVDGNRGLEVLHIHLSSVKTASGPFVRPADIGLGRLARKIVQVLRSTAQGRFLVVRCVESLLLVR